jgi:hypothetical protein
MFASGDQHAGAPPRDPHRLIYRASNGYDRFQVVMQFADGYDGSIPLTKEYSEMVSIRSGIVSDVPLLRTLIQEFATFERLPVAITEEQLRQDGFGAQPRFRILIAECDGQPAGYALFFECYSSFQGRGIFSEDLFVRPSLRGKNVGRALLGHVAPSRGERSVL